MNGELDEATADRLLSGEVAPRDAPPGYARVATLLEAARAGPSPSELARQAEAVRAMAAARPAPEQVPLTRPVASPVPLARRRKVQLGALAAATTLCFSTGLAAAGLLPGPLQSVASDVLSSLGVPPPGSDDAEDPGRRPESAPPKDVPGPPRDGNDVPGPSPEAQKPSGPKPMAPEARPPGQAKAGPRSVLVADAAPNGLQLVVSFRETGVSAGAVDVQVRAEATATYGCVDQGRRKDRVHREGRVTGVSQAARRFSAVSGTVGGALTLSAPPPTGLSCPSGQTPRLLGVLYSRVVVQDITTGTSAVLNRTFPAKA